MMRGRYATYKSSVEYQKRSWDALRKSINGLVNKLTATNIKNIIPELLSENLLIGGSVLSVLYEVPNGFSRSEEGNNISWAVNLRKKPKGIPMLMSPRMKTKTRLKK
ncbi:hypothetical protein DM860_011095 [Cuscuta australis]|uniref:Uncharacterized protein n=1 Tax=Cuscuta australis TaxID=267555 RepID=A0A328E570_9ASTE|nr:hypothetical protein DM860_011095 [Cuscuta australis]